MTRAKFETVAGVVTRGETYAQLLEKLIEAQELMLVMGHLHQTEDTGHDRIMAKAWREIAHLHHQIRNQVTKLAMNKLQ